MAFLDVRRSCSFFFSTFFVKARRFYISNIFNSGLKTEAVSNMKTVFFQYHNNKVNITLHFNNTYIDRMLHFQRMYSEDVNTFLRKLENRLQDLIMKKVKKMKKNKTELTVPDDIPQIQACLLLNDKQPQNILKFEDIFQNNSNQELKLRIFNEDYNVLLNYPMISQMTLPKLILAGTFICPETFVAEFTDNNKSDFTWFKSLTAADSAWEKCGEGYFYEVKQDDKSHFLKLMCTPKMNEKVGPSLEVVSKDPVKELEGLSEIKKRHEFTKERTMPDEIRIVSYNVLGDNYTQTKEAKTQLFTFCDPAILDFNYRRNLLNFELLGYNADIICLQEVDVKLFKYYRNFFDMLGYDCVFHEKEGPKEGCLCIYDRQKFNVISTNQYTFSKELLSNPLFEDIKVKLQENEKIMGRLPNVSSQMQVVVLEHFSKDVLILGHTHLYFHPDADHIRLLQGIMLLKILLNTVEEIKKQEPNKRISVLICGDFNSTPECGFHQLLNTGLISSDHIDWRSKEDEEIKNVDFQHSMKMKSAYDNTQCTNFTPLFKACIDFIYYQTDHLELKQTVPIPSEDVLSKFSGIPSLNFPSDHVALIADFKFKSK